MIALENGAEEGFEGSEEVVIENGLLEVAE